jgi:hypothetical protein
MNRITRLSTKLTTTVAQTAALSGAVNMQDYAGGGFKTPAALTATTKIAFKVAEEESGTYVGLYDSSGVLVEVTVDVGASKAYPLPDDLFGWPWFKFWTEAGGSDVAQAAARDLIVVLKG